ncbi:putative F-box protein [Hibiscus syriacus]|uniref:F-box protein n=1 Tax=Hibiscus syriacus TaxID=106335 RepID=A0A6A3B127_HIBSY|nr:putative F-box protein [Hibiscus syriacus]
MAFIVDQQQSDFKHFCRICKKGFGSGRALGGHMRAHGIGDESGHIDDDDHASDWEDKLGRNVPPSNKRMYELRTNPNRLKTCRVCENCGKEFLSWKSFLEHGKCSSDDAESLVSSPGSDGDNDTMRRGCGWSKRKRSFRANVDDFNFFFPSSEEEDLANCLMLLSNATVHPFVTEPDESCASASKEEERRNTMNFIAPIACRVGMDKARGVAKGLFECKACRKVFNSHQALGGHRASHRRNEHSFGFCTQKEIKVHECSICHRVFSSGQALGGHKRCHWITSKLPDTSSLAKFHRFQDRMEPNFIDNSEPLNLKFDLNLPAATDHHDIIRRKHDNHSGFDVSTGILQLWLGGGDAKDKEDNQHQLQQVDNQNNNDHCNSFMRNAEDETDRKLKLTKLKDINMSGGSSPWLQVGIGI